MLWICRSSFRKATKIDFEKGGKPFIVGAEGCKANATDYHGGFVGGGAYDSFPAGGGGYSCGRVDFSVGR